jgi:hypothetical protein
MTKTDRQARCTPSAKRTWPPNGFASSRRSLVSEIFLSETVRNRPESRLTRDAAPVLPHGFSLA